MAREVLLALHGVTACERMCACQVRNQGCNEDALRRARVVETLPAPGTCCRNTPGHYTLDFEFIFGHLVINAFYCCQTLRALHAVMLDITRGLKKLWFREPALKAIKASVLTRYYSLPSGISGCLFSVHTEVTG